MEYSPDQTGLEKHSGRTLKARTRRREPLHVRTRKKEAFQLVLSPVLTDGTGESEEERDGEREKIILLSTVIALTNLCPKATEKTCFL